MASYLAARQAASPHGSLPISPVTLVRAGTNKRSVGVGAWGNADL